MVREDYNPKKRKPYFVGDPRDFPKLLTREELLTPKDFPKLMILEKENIEANKKYHTKEERLYKDRKRK